MSDDTRKPITLEQAIDQVLDGDGYAGFYVAADGTR